MHPVNTSTPNPGVKRVGGRKSIHDKEVPSPVQPETLKNDKIKNNSNLKKDVKVIKEDSVENDDDVIETNTEETNLIQEEEEENELEEEEERNLNYYCENYKFALSHTFFILVIIIPLMLPGHYFDTNLKNTNISINSIKNKFPNQTLEFWHYITSSIKEVQLFNKPSIILLLYLANHERKSNDLIVKISQFASQNLNENSIDPIILDGSKLNTVQYLKDYGILIEDYKNALENRRVMVVRNLENVKANVSQAFHVICDEYTPLVEKAFIMLGLKVPWFAEKEVEQAGGILRNLWGDLEGDILEPLVARVTNLVLKINPEL